MELQRLYLLHGQDEIDAAVKILLSLKADYKSASGREWYPNKRPVEAKSPLDYEFYDKVTEQWNKVKDLKAQKATKVTKA